MFDNNKKIFLSVFVFIAAYLVDYLFIHTGESTLLELKAGKLRGKISVSRGGREFYEFLGVPYAEPPLKNLRFLSPKPASAKIWKDPIDATNYKSKCLQVDLITHVKSGSEDCLYLNVFSPKTKGVPTPFPVIVFFHGGYYVSGDAKMFGPKYFMDEDVVLVTVNYRLASLGFLNAGNKYARGNQGLKDQVSALKWVQENIAYFGGDPNSVTISGHSSGGASVHLHMLSKMSSGLFHRAISSSGTALSPWAISSSPMEQAKRIARRLRCPTKGKSEAMVACLGQSDVQRLVESHRESIHMLHDPLSIYKPSIETIDDNEAFLTDDPVKVIKRGKIVNKVPWIVGINSEEGMVLASVLVRNNSMIQAFEKDWEANFQKLLLYSSKDPEVPKKIRDYYFGTSEEKFVTRENLEKFSKLFSDREYFVGTHNSAMAHGKKSPVFAYQFTEPVPISLAEVIWNQPGMLPAVVEMGVFLAFNWVRRMFGTIDQNKGVAHFDDQTFFFNMPYMPEYPKGDENYEFSTEIVKLWVTFAKNGEPGEFKGVKWEPIDAKSESVPKYLKISRKPQMIDEPFTAAVTFWNSLNLT